MSEGSELADDALHSQTFKRCVELYIAAMKIRFFTKVFFSRASSKRLTLGPVSSSKNIFRGPKLILDFIAFSVPLLSGAAPAPKSRRRSKKSRARANLPPILKYICRLYLTIMLIKLKIQLLRLRFRSLISSKAHR
jgi:hypothetical protein